MELRLGLRQLTNYIFGEYELMHSVSFESNSKEKLLGYTRKYIIFTFSYVSTAHSYYYFVLLVHYRHFLYE